MSVSGTPKNVAINGSNFDVDAAADFTIKPESVVTTLPTSGSNVFQITKQSADVEGVTLSCDATAYLLLKGSHDSINIHTLSYTLADGSVFSAPGKINLEGWASSTNVATITLMPETAWSPFVA